MKFIHNHVSGTLALTLALFIILAGSCVTQNSNGKVYEEQAIDIDDSSFNQNNLKNDDDVDGCEGTESPMLLGVELIVNGEQTTMPATVLITDQLEIAMEYYDADCNLNGGNIRILPDTLEPKYGELDDYLYHIYFITNSGCSSDQEGAPYYLNITPTDYLLPTNLERTLPLEFHLEDVCGFPSQPFFLPLDFTVVEKMTDDDTATDDDNETGGSDDDNIDDDANPVRDDDATQASEGDNGDSGSGGCVF